MKGVSGTNHNYRTAKQRSTRHKLSYSVSVMESLSWFLVTSYHPYLGQEMVLIPYRILIHARLHINSKGKISTTELVFHQECLRTVFCCIIEKKSYSKAYRAFLFHFGPRLPSSLALDFCLPTSPSTFLWEFHLEETMYYD